MCVDIGQSTFGLRSHFSLIPQKTDTSHRLRSQKRGVWKGALEVSSPSSCCQKVWLDQDAQGIDTSFHPPSKMDFYHLSGGWPPSRWLYFPSFYLESPFFQLVFIVSPCAPQDTSASAFSSPSNQVEMRLSNSPSLDDDQLCTTNRGKVYLLFILQRENGPHIL